MNITSFYTKKIDSISFKNKKIHMQCENIELTLFNPNQTIKIYFFMHNIPVYKFEIKNYYNYTCTISMDIF